MAKLATLRTDKRYAHLFGADGQPLATAWLAAEDATLKSLFAALNVELRFHVIEWVRAYEPTHTQRALAKAAGVDLEAQRRRFLKLLAFSPPLQAAGLGGT